MSGSIPSPGSKEYTIDMAHAGGRPTEFKEEYIQKVLDYLKTCGGHNQRLPKRVDLALMFNCHEETLIEWGKVHPLFSDALTRVDAMQKGQLMDDGFYGGKEVNPRMGQFLLSANHGMKDRSDITSGDKPIPILSGVINVPGNNSNNEDTEAN